MVIVWGSQNRFSGWPHYSSSSSLFGMNMGRGKWEIILVSLHGGIKVLTWETAEVLSLFGGGLEGIILLVLIGFSWLHRHCVDGFYTCTERHLIILGC